MMTDDDYEMEEPLANGIDSVNWLPTVIGAKASEPSNDNEVSHDLKQASSGNLAD